MVPRDAGAIAAAVFAPNGASTSLSSVVTLTLRQVRLPDRPMH
ncbi:MULTISPECIES: hypothetical protein [unclassified Microbacterium]|nr:MULTISPECIES: hypothetical protein [unclassified Microbacterium]